MISDMIRWSLICFWAAYGLTLLLTKLNIGFSLRVGLVDTPNSRSVHKDKLPTGGGISIALGVILVQVLISFFVTEYESKSILLKLALFDVAVVCIGLVDDFRRVKAWYKLVCEIVLATGLYFAGFQIQTVTNLFGPEFNTGLFSYPITVTWFLIVMNAFNLVDGIDGLAAGIATISGFVLCLIGIMSNNLHVVIVSSLLVATNLAFLKYNFYPAKIFMGDTGSLFIGMNIAAIASAGVSQFKGITSITLLVPILLLVLPLMDTILAVFRRLINKKNIFKADKEHIHHKLLRLGWSQKAIAYFAYFTTFLFGMIAIGFSFSTKRAVICILISLLLFLLGCFYFWLKRELYK